MIDMTQVNEQRRTYHWSDGSEAIFDSVTHFGMPGTTHRLKLATGELVIVKPDWRYIVIDGAKEFTL